MNTPQLNVVYFKRDITGTSKGLDHDLKDLAVQFGDSVNFFTINVEYETEIDGDYQIMTLPTVLLFKKGAQIDRLSGCIDRTLLSQSIERHIAI